MRRPGTMCPSPAPTKEAQGDRMKSMPLSLERVQKKRNTSANGQGASRGKGKKRQGQSYRPQHFSLVGILQAAGVVCQVGCDTFCSRCHARLARSPTGRTNLTAGLEEIHGVEQAQNLVNATAERKIVHHLDHYGAIFSNKEGSAHSESGFLVKDIVGVGHAAIFIAKQWVFHRTNATLVDGGFAPLGVSFCVVNGDTQNLGAALIELIHTMVKSDQFRRSDESEILRVEEEDDVLALVIRQGNLLGRAVFHDRSGREIGRGFIGEDRHGFVYGSGQKPWCKHSRAVAIFLNFETKRCALECRNGPFAAPPRHDSPIDRGLDSSAHRFLCRGPAHAGHPRNLYSLDAAFTAH